MMKGTLIAHCCEICGRKFTEKAHLKFHMNINNGDRQNKCDFCSKYFSHKGNEDEHNRTHTGVLQWTVVCEYCGKTFKAPDKMLVHRRFQTGEKPYICLTCGRGFCESGNLKKQMKVQ